MCLTFYYLKCTVDDQIYTTPPDNYFGRGRIREFTWGGREPCVNNIAYRDVYASLTPSMPLSTTHCSCVNRMSHTKFNCKLSENCSCQTLVFLVKNSTSLQGHFQFAISMWVELHPIVSSPSPSRLYMEDIDDMMGIQLVSGFSAQTRSAQYIWCHTDSLKKVDGV